MADLLDAVPREQRLAVPEPTGMAIVIERLASNPAVDVTKLEKLIELQERMLAHNAKASFNAAFSVMQGEIPAIVEKGKTNNGSYAPLEDIVEAVRPILTKHGFALTHRTEWPDKGIVKIVGILSHQQGHERQSEFLSAADSSGNKNAIQGLGSAISYGRRYTTKDLLGIVTRGEDDDAKLAGKNDRHVQREPPDGYDDWFLDLEGTAASGLAPLQDAWKKSPSAYRKYLTETDGRTWEDLKRKAAAVKAVSS